MGRKKKKFKPIVFCYYCDRTFENEKVLIQHQRAKHFKCIVCHKRLGSAHGMMVHVFQVHKQQIDKVPHAKEGRDSFHVDIFGMSNIPQQVLDEKHTERGEPPSKRQKVNAVPIQHHMNPINGIPMNPMNPMNHRHINPMFPNPMMMNQMMMNPMNPMMMPHPMPPPPPPPYHPYMNHPPIGPPQPMHQPIPYPMQQQPMQPIAQPMAPPISQPIPQTIAKQTVNDESVKSNEIKAENNNTNNTAIKKSSKKHHLLYSNEMISMEEQRFLHSQYHWTPQKVPNTTDQAK